MITFHIVSVLILDICDEKYGKWEEGKILIFALITGKLEFSKYKQIAFIGCLRNFEAFLISFPHSPHSKGRISLNHKDVLWNELKILKCSAIVHTCKAPSLHGHFLLKGPRKYLSTNKKPKSNGGEEKMAP